MRPGSQMVTQMAVSVALGCFNDQSHIAACQRGHVKLQLCMAERSSFGGKLRGLCRAPDFRCDLGAFDGFLGLIPHDNLKEGSFASKPSFGVEQFQM